jgi:tRNA(Arg) A34 adenosine deaminase TadA
MCVATLVVAGVSKLYYAADIGQAGEAFAGVPVSKRHPIDVDRVRTEAGTTIDDRGMPAEQHRSAEAVAVLTEWASQ